MPILMRIAAKYAGKKYREFCLEPGTKCEVNIRCAKDFSYDWVNVMSDAFAEAESYGVKMEYPEDSLPLNRSYVVREISDINKLRVLKVEDHDRLKARIFEIEEYQKRLGDNYLICGWVEGPFAEYCNIRNLSLACMDFFENPRLLEKALDIMTESAIAFASAQVKAGAHCIGIGDAACSLISPDLYQEFVFPREKLIIDHIHSMGALIKLHICGNTTAIVPDMIKTGADIVDLDHNVESIENFTYLIGENQVFSGNSDPVTVIQNGTPELIAQNVEECYLKTNKRGIVSAGCEITPETSIENLLAYSDCVNNLQP